MTESSVQSFSTLMARLHPRARFVQFPAALVSIVLLSACASSPWYDAAPVMPVKVSPPEGAVVTSGTAVIFAWNTTFQAEAYDFHIFNVETSAIDQYMLTGLEPAEICSGDTCSISLQLSLPDSERHAWRVRSSNMAGQSAWTRSLFTFSSKGAQ